MSDFEDANDYGNLDAGTDAVMQEASSVSQRVDASIPHGEEEEEKEEFDEEQGVQEDEDDEEDDDDDDDDEEEEDIGRKGKKRSKHRHNRSAASRFLDIEAVVSDDDDEEEDEEDYGADGFIDKDDTDDDAARRHHALLDSKRLVDDAEDRSPEQIAKDLSRRYGGRAVRYTGDMNDVPQRLLMPSVHDASLWQVRVKPGRERDIVFSLIRKSIDVEYTANPLSILSAFQRDSLPGMIYIEARSAKMVQQACNGLVGIYLSRGIHLVPIEEMSSLLQIKKQSLTVTPGSWVRIKRGKYAGDLAQVMDITENGEDVGLKFIPRIDLTPRDEAALEGAKKRKKTGPGNPTLQPPQRPFNYEEVVKVWGRKFVSKRNQVYIFQNETYKDGFIEKDFKINALVLKDVNPTLDEITQFIRGQDGGDVENAVDLSIIAEASRKAAVAVLQPGDHVEVFESEQAGVHGVVDEITGDIVTITAIGVDLDGQKVEVPARSVRKRFKPGDHVKVMAGQNANETGLVVAIADNVVTFLSDMSMQEVSVFSKDLREAAEVGLGTNIVGNYELHDLVQLDAQTVGVIFKTERDSFRVLDQHSQDRLVQPHQISMRRDSARAIATDFEGHELCINDNVKEIDGEGRKGRVLHIHQSFYAFLHNRDVAEHGGVFVARARSLTSLAPRSTGLTSAPAADLSKMNPALMPPPSMVGSGAMGRGPRDRHIGLPVMVIKGTYKGYAGTIKDTNGLIARVELRTGNKVISIEKEKLHFRHQSGALEPLGKVRGPDFRNGPGGRPSNNTYAKFGSGINGSGSGYGAGGGRTPFGGNVVRTPNPYNAEGRTPAWNASSQTPNPYVDGGKTPAWTASSRTPNPYAGVDSGTALALNGGGGWGGASPAKAWGGATPRHHPDWELSTRTGWSDEAAWSAPTPAAAATPGLDIGQTPEFAATHVASARTPAGVWGSSSNVSAPTPGAGCSSYHDPSDTPDDELDPDWLHDPAFTQYLPRIKIEIHGTRMDNYLQGDYEGRYCRPVAVSKFSQEFDQMVTVQFDGGENRSILSKYIVPAAPSRKDEEVLVLKGKEKGRTVVVRQKPDDPKVAVSTRAAPSVVFEVPKEALVALYE